MEPALEQRDSSAPETIDQKDRLFRRLVLGVTLTGAAVRIILLIARWNDHVSLTDAFYYSVQASDNSKGNWFRQPFTNLPSAEHPPLTSLVITPASLLSHHEFWQRATMTVLGILVVPLIAVVGRRIGGRRVGVIAALLAAFYPNLWMSDSLIMSETITVLLVTLALLAALRYQERFDLKAALLCGLAVGFAANARSEVLLFAPLFALIGIRSHPWRQWVKGAIVLVLAATLMVVPWIGYNLSRFDSPVLMSTNDGTTLLGANCPETYGGVGLGGWNLNCLFETNPPAAEDTAERSVRRRHEALAYARAHKGRLPLVVSARLLRAADLYGLHDLVRGDIGEERYEWAIWSGIASWWVLVPLAVVGWWRVRKRFGYVLIVPVINVFVVTVAFYGAHRLRSPMEPVVVLCAGVALASIPAVRRWITEWSNARITGGSAPTAEAVSREEASSLA